MKFFFNSHTVSKWRVSIFKLGSIVVVWWLDLQLPVQSVPITTTVHGKVYSIQHYVIKFVSDLR